MTDPKPNSNLKTNIDRQMTILHQNSQIATNKGDELSLLCEEIDPDLLIVTEHGFNNSNIMQFKIQNYQLGNFYCRSSAKGGGAAVFVKNTFSFTAYRLTESTDKNFEVTGVKVQTSKGQLAIIGLYRSPSGNAELFLSKFEQLLSDVSNKGSFIVMGDFNIDVLDVNDPVTRRFEDVLKSFGLRWAINSPTRVTEHSATAIDNVVTNLTDVLVSVINTAISDHHGQQVTINGLQPKRYPLNKKTIRDVRPSNIVLLNNLLSKENWGFFNFEEPVEAQFQNFERTFSYHLNVSCPLKQIQQKPKNKKCTWITKGILISREKLLFYSELRKHTLNVEFKSFFQNYKRIYRKVIKSAKAYDVTKTLLTSKNFSKSAWTIINNKNSQSDKQIELTIENEQVNNPLRVAGEFNKFFASVGADQGLRPSDSQPPPSSIPSPAASMALTPVTEEEIARVMRDLPSKKNQRL